MSATTANNNNGRSVSFAADRSQNEGTTTTEKLLEEVEEEVVVEDVDAADDQQQQEAAAASATADTTTTTTNAAAARTQHQQILCPNCGSTSIEFTDASGHSVCVDCGVVVEENAIVSAVEFVEGAGGASAMVGQFVSATSSKAYTGGGDHGGGGHRGGGGSSHVRGGRYGFSRDSRETTLANGRRKIQEVASRLRLGSHYVDAAHRLFTIAVEKNFVQGRRTTHVVAACLYIACRQEKSQHMLIDFSDALQVNVYTLGTCFLKFRRLLGLKLEIIDPALYVYRFAAHLGLDDKANAVALSALRLVGRMKRDWIVAGRRPAGICAAALLIAARAHGFSKHHSDVTRILRVCGLTVSTRVKEFEQTPSANLTLQQFNNTAIAASASAAAAGTSGDETDPQQQEADPPVFRRNRILEARAKAIQDGDVTLLASGALDDPMAKTAKIARSWRDPNARSKTNDKKVHFQKLYDNIVEELEEDAKAGDNDRQQQMDSTSEDGNSAVEKQQAVGTGEPSSSSIHEKQLASVPDMWKDAYPKSKYGRALVLPDHSTAEERQKSTEPLEGKLNLAAWKEDMPESIDKEIDSLFRTEEEEKQKETIFNKLNKDYIEQQQRKENERLTAEAATESQAKLAAHQIEGHARYKNRQSGGGGAGNNKKKRSREEGGGCGDDHEDAGGGDHEGNDNDDHQGGESGTGGGGGDDRPEDSVLTTEEQLMAAVNSRKISRKINYDALTSIFDEDGSFATGSVGGSGAVAGAAAGDEGRNGGGGDAASGGDGEEVTNKDTNEDPLFEMI